MGVSIYIPPQLSRNNVHARIMSLLRETGRKAMYTALRTHETKRDKGNQENAYGYGIYVDGVLEDWSRPASVWPAEEAAEIGGRKYWGHEEIEKFLQEYVPDVAGYVLVVVNAMVYSSWQEEGFTTKSGKHRTYRIITQTYGYLKNEANDIAKALRLKNADVRTWYWTRGPQDKMHR